MRFDLITPIGLRRLAETCAEGARKYGDCNWQKGIPASQMLNHAIRHIYLWLEGDVSEDHLAHAAWNILGVCHFEEMMPDMIDVPSRRPPHGHTDSSSRYRAEAHSTLRVLESASPDSSSTSTS